MESISKRDRSRRAELQRLLGEHGTILPRVAHGTPDCPAQGWYAELPDGSLRFLGDYTGLATVAIVRWVQNGNGSAQELRPEG